MIALVRGNLIIKAPQFVVVDVSGIGYKVFIPLSTFPKLPPLKEEVTFHIHTHLKEDAIQLYGFMSIEERDFFLTLLTISGIGPKMGLNIMSGSTLPALMEILEQDDVKRLSMIPGVGKKTAARIILELKEKLISIASSPTEKGEAVSKVSADALSALINLGYSRAHAGDAISRAIKDGRKETLEEVIREALKDLASFGGR